MSEKETEAPIIKPMIDELAGRLSPEPPKDDEIPPPRGPVHPPQPQPHEDPKPDA